MFAHSDCKDKVRVRHSVLSELLSMFGITASQLQSLPVDFSPWFDLCHYTLAALAVRKEVGLNRSRTNPLSTWMATMSASFAGSLLANPLLGQFPRSLLHCRDTEI